ncbi:MAG: molybdopterin-guanine dinucleotide biosynthesis protein B [Candidatus Saccharibacteria bacterium]|nr:molybdopterin-guanine dinucleotide biosynthesis protein B [Pseudorhodobacter sp.]
MKIYGVIGWKNAGKTSLMDRLVADITARGLTVSTVKHVHHDVDLDQPGKDTHRHRMAGASEVILASAHRFALMHEHRGPEPRLTDILSRLTPVDLVLVEGYKRDAHAKIEVYRAETGHDLIQPTDPTTRAVATDAPLGPLSVPVLNLNDTRAVADFILAESGLLPQQFETVIVVDWSASAALSPARPCADAIWIGVTRDGQTTTTYHRSRHAAETFLTDLLDAEQAQGRRVLAGIDFAFGYPTGFAAALTGHSDPRAVWAWLNDHIVDGSDNQNNRFAVADQINARLGGEGPFWGHPQTARHSHLQPTKPARPAFPDRRLVETRVPSAQSVWKLYTAGSVGSQSLMGLPLIHRLSQRPDTAVWPFARPTTGLVIAEVYPSLLATAVKADPGPIKDQVQTSLLSRALWTLSHRNQLTPLFDTPDIAQEEGWILGASHHAVLESALK